MLVEIAFWRSLFFCKLPNAVLSRLSMERVLDALLLAALLFAARVNKSSAD